MLSTITDGLAFYAAGLVLGTLYALLQEPPQRWLSVVWFSVRLAPYLAVLVVFGSAACSLFNSAFEAHARRR
jgi:hypothetical protein